METNIRSWYENIPIKRLIIGLAKEDKKVRVILKQFENVVIINQNKHKTLGYCIKELVSKVEGDWFIFLHDDVKLFKGWFDNMWRYIEQFNIDIAESLKEPITIERVNQAKSWRAYSGAQIIKKIVYDACMQDIEDDTIYTTEDLILQIRAMEKGFKYTKIPIFHEHQARVYDTPNGLRSERSIDYETVLIMQIKSLVTYCSPIKPIKEMINGTFDALKKEMIGGWDK